MEPMGAVVRNLARGCAEPNQMRITPSLLRRSLLLASLAGSAALHGQVPIVSAKIMAPALPDSPGALMTQSSAFAAESSADAVGLPTQAGAANPKLPPCRVAVLTSSPEANASERAGVRTQPPCQAEDPVQPFVSSRVATPLTAKQKGELALRDTVDPFNLMTIALSSGFDIGINAHSAYGPGLEGWGKLSGYTVVEDAQGEFFGTFLICSIAHEDPRYHRMPNATVKRRILHALAHTVISQHDDGSPMPNYATLLTYPFSAELSNLYVPGVATDLPNTAKRVAIGLATDPSGTLVSEFLPDLARRIHVNVIFIQEILNQVITGSTAPNVQ